MGFLWTFMWIVTYRDFAYTIGTSGDEEAFIHPSSKVLFIMKIKFIRFVVS
jgi:hypothetical protein